MEYFNGEISQKKRSKSKDFAYYVVLSHLPNHDGWPKITLTIYIKLTDYEVQEGI
jgi:hypothetical protein